MSSHEASRTVAHAQPAGATTRAVIALGGNLGDREDTLDSAVRALGATEGVHVVAVSDWIETAALRPWGIDPDAPAYLNGVAVVDTVLGPQALLDVLNAIERDHGRIRGERWGDRTLDLDLVDHGGRTLHTERLTLPHPRAHDREFVLRPWVAVDPDAQLVGHGRVADLLARLDDHHDLNTQNAEAK